MIKLKFKGRELSVHAKKVSPLGMFSGLMFKSSTTENLLFEFKHKKSAAIHSCFVFFDFMAAWLDEENRVVDHMLVRPFTLSIKPKVEAKKLVEIPINEKNNSIINFLVGKGKV